LDTHGDIHNHINTAPIEGPPVPVIEGIPLPILPNNQALLGQIDLGATVAALAQQRLERLTTRRTR